MRLYLSLLAASAILVACVENGEDEDEVQGYQCEFDQEIVLVTPAEGEAVPVKPCGFAETQDCFEVRATFACRVEDRDSIEVVLEQGGDVLPGTQSYSVTSLRVTFAPFAILESREPYTVTVRADGLEVSRTFTTEAAHEGSIPDIEGRTFAFSIEEFLSPEQLTSVFNTMRSSIPDNLINVNRVDPLEGGDDDESATVRMVGAAAQLGVTPPRLIEEDPEQGVFTSTGLRLEGRVRGNWFIIGPGQVSLVASGVPFVVRDFVATGIFSADGDSIEEGYLTGLLNIEDLGNAVGYDLSSICTSPVTGDVCDAEGNARLAGRIGADTVDVGFDCFITKPINKSVDNDPDTVMETYCTYPLDAETELTLEICDDAEDAPARAKTETLVTDWDCYVGEGRSLEGTTSVAGKSAVFTPSEALPSGAWFRLRVSAVAEDGGETKVRHAVFRTP